MNIKLTIDGKEKIFYLKRVKGSSYRMLLEMNQKIMNSNNDNELEMLDMLVTFICQVFDNQFTEDDLLDNLEPHELMNVMFEISKMISEKTNKSMQKLSKN